MEGSFAIQSRAFTATLDPDTSASFSIASVPRPYPLHFASSADPVPGVEALVSGERHPLLLVDRKVHEGYLARSAVLGRVPSVVVDAIEDRKEIGTVLEIVSFLVAQSATRRSMLFVVGGGIVQDLGAFASAMYKRGIPWTLVPTTLLAQGDSCVGGKAALNHDRTKNLLGLFSAPRRVHIDAGFLDTLARHDVLSGGGELFRLLVTGGPEFVRVLERELPAFLDGSREATIRLVANALSVKRAVVEVDEFELDLRRSMNYGHSVGHAVEALSDYAVPHGTGVCFGILVENEISFRRGMLSRADRDRLLAIGRRLLPAASVAVLRAMDLHGILDILMKDKKTEGSTLILATLETLGQMRFVPLSLDAAGRDELEAAFRAVLDHC